MYFHLSMRNMWSCLVGLAIATGYAHGQAVTFNTPFQFEVGQTVMPAGAYTIRRFNPINPSVLLLQPVDRHKAISGDFFNASLIENNRAALKNDVVFNCYHGECFLSQIWTESDNYGLQLAPSREERLLARGGLTPNVYVLAALRP